MTYDSTVLSSLRPLESHVNVLTDGTSLLVCLTMISLPLLKSLIPIVVLFLMLILVLSRIVAPRL
jgi:hypothetical protein